MLEQRSIAYYLHYANQWGSQRKSGFQTNHHIFKLWFATAFCALIKHTLKLQQSEKRSGSINVTPPNCGLPTGGQYSFLVYFLPLFAF